MKPLSTAVLWVTAGDSEYQAPVTGSRPSRRPLGSVRSKLVTGSEASDSPCAALPWRVEGQTLAEHHGRDPSRPRGALSAGRGSRLSECRGSRAARPDVPARRQP